MKRNCNKASNVTTMRRRWDWKQKKKKKKKGNFQTKEREREKTAERSLLDYCIGEAVVCESAENEPRGVGMPAVKDLTKRQRRSCRNSGCATQSLSLTSRTPASAKGPREPSGGCGRPASISARQ